MNANNVKITFKGNPMTLLGKEAKVGEKAENFTLIGNDLQPVTLDKFKGKVVVLSIFPSLDTPVCATQNRTFNKEAAELGDDIVILGISKDLPFAQARFCGAEGIDKVITLSDYRGMGFCEQYGFFIKELGLFARGTVVIDKEGTIQFVEYVPEATDEPDYKAALEAAKKLV